MLLKKGGYATGALQDFNTNRRLHLLCPICFRRYSV